MAGDEPWEEAQEWAEDDTPFADPAIRSGFIAALGAFILAFNEVDYWLGHLLRWELRSRRAEAVFDSKATFSVRLKQLEALALDGEAPPVAALPFARLRQIAEDRNKLAHGHFDQNPFDGSYDLVLRQQAHDFPIERIDGLMIELSNIALEFRSAFHWREFDDIADPPSQGG
jgi:hypothetical protein